MDSCLLLNMNRHRLLAGAGIALLSGCLSNSGLLGGRPVPDEEDGLEYEHMMSVSDWFDDDFKDELRQPHAILVTEDERARSLPGFSRAKMRKRSFRRRILVRSFYWLSRFEFSDSMSLTSTE